MRIGIDGRLWNETGVGRYIRALVTELSALDTKHEYILFLRKDTYSVFKTLNPNWKTVLADIHWHSLAEQTEMPRIYKSADLDVLHIPYFSVPLMAPKPFVVTIHDLTVTHHATGQATTKPLPIYLAKRLAYQLVINQAVKNACRIITVSKTVKKQLEQEFHLDADRVSVTYESGKLESTSEKIKVQPPKPYILYVGNAHPHKNLKNLVLAFSQLLKTHPTLHLVLAGKKDFFYQRLEQLIDLEQLHKSVHLLGEVKNGELVSLYEQAEAFVFPSSSEGFGIPGLEAMSVGCPVVCSDLPVFKEIYKDGAVYFDHKNPAQIANAILGVVSNKTLRRKLMIQGKQIADSYSWKKMAQETLAIYENCTRL